MKPYSGIWPVAPTAFNDNGTLDLDGSMRALECMIDQGSDGVCILANYSEQFLISDEPARLEPGSSFNSMTSRMCLIDVTAVRKSATIAATTKGDEPW